MSLQLWNSSFTESKTTLDHTNTVFYNFLQNFFFEIFRNFLKISKFSSGSQIVQEAPSFRQAFMVFVSRFLLCHIEICILILACFWSAYFHKLYFLWRAYIFEIRITRSYCSACIPSNTASLFMIHSLCIQEFWWTVQLLASIQLLADSIESNLVGQFRFARKWSRNRHEIDFTSSSCSLLDYILPFSQSNSIKPN